MRSKVEQFYWSFSKRVGMLAVCTSQEFHILRACNDQLCLCKLQAKKPKKHLALGKRVVTLIHFSSVYLRYQLELKDSKMFFLQIQSAGHSWTSPSQFGRPEMLGASWNQFFPDFAYAPPPKKKIERSNPSPNRLCSRKVRITSARRPRMAWRSSSVGLHSA